MCGVALGCADRAFEYAPPLTTPSCCRTPLMDLIFLAVALSSPSSGSLIFVRNVSSLSASSQQLRSVKKAIRRRCV